MQLYDKDSFCKEFRGKVLECTEGTKEELGALWQVVLSETAFYPEGGGQPCDLGFLGESEVVQVEKIGEKVVHWCKVPLLAGSEVVGRLDWAHRFDLMQQHSGEHLFSGLAHAAFGCDNVGFHIGKLWVTIDLNRPLTQEQLSQLEAETNRYIWEDHQVEISYPTAEELTKLEYRSKKELEGAVRIVHFPNGDTCACCGTHVNRTGQIGLVKLFSWEKFRDGVRINLLCGGRALRYLSEIAMENGRVSQLLSAKPLETGEGTTRLLGEQERLKERVRQLELERLDHLAKTHQSEGDVTLFVANTGADHLRILAVELSKTSQGRCACFASGEEGVFRYAIASQVVDVRPICQEMNQTFAGRGGGKPNLVQGSVVAKEADLEHFLTSK